MLARELVLVSGHADFSHAAMFAAQTAYARVPSALAKVNIDYSNWHPPAVVTPRSSAVASRQHSLPQQVDDMYTIVVRGLRSDMITAVCEPLPHLEKNDSVAFRLIHWERMMAHDIVSLGARGFLETSAEAYWRTRLAIRSRELSSWYVDYPCFCKFAAAVRQIPQYAQLFPKLPEAPDSLPPSSFEVEVDDKRRSLGYSTAAATELAPECSAWGGGDAQF
ncbi:uncharacterized protein B0I36DRAFT_358834 [Microdochium trichocladiopsis]|uniref:Uncharacterized protein n=1 Tax=Microdochium trichocladiopsis TaxID=1682393 RepID=A0A9P8YD80_9PEZI|nr:uncharacterized protein B0I36DRAFT_358834 [Microdochium trichocladiopsis]KAH7037084.1 hypothetical protein B0I36DRAFT_358834 [Microdochium trichocladiopsis]